VRINFLQKLKDKNIDYQLGKYKLLNEVFSWEARCLVLDDFGCEHELLFKSLMKCQSLTIDSALDKRKYLVELLKSKGYYKNYTIIGDYILGSKEIEVMTNYGICKIKPNTLLLGKFPNIRSAVNKTEYFINMSIERQGFKYSYNNVVWISATSKVEIGCNVTGHGTFWQTPNNHLNGRGCDKCRTDSRSNKALGWSLSMWIDRAEKSKNFDSFKLYILRCWNDNEEFYKVGRTFTTVFERYNNRFSYNYEIITEQVMTAEQCYKKEIKIRSLNKDNRYKPLNKFNGYTECYKIINNYE